MVYFKMSMEIQLINQIEKYEFLYNFNLPEYNRKDLVDEAWTTIAANTNMSVSDCKEKWRNIRSSFLRSMKPSGSKVKKPYYLTEYLKFILPFLKPINVDNAEEGHYNEQQASNGNTDPQVIVSFIKEEPDEFENDVHTENNTETGILNDLLTRQPPVMRKRRRFIPVGRRNLAEMSKLRGKITSNYQNDSTNNSNHALKMFLMSLLPELDTMTEDQIRLFKIKSMMLIDDIKSNYTQMRQNISTIDSNRLQKRLINLLLKNLQRTTEVNCKDGDRMKED
ncbi:uncharacterized protein LOC142978342 [Anticarsia gemmatalis]|uniref:uncharacterized protein LOC142978342 n=1 Tax=Anticarsia gemmatalis TaxID=129554 RepID=UPI003F762B9E